MYQWERGGGGGGGVALDVCIVFITITRWLSRHILSRDERGRKRDRVSLLQLPQDDYEI